MPTSIQHIVRFRGQRWTCSCHARGVGETSAEAHAYDRSGRIELAGAR